MELGRTLSYGHYRFEAGLLPLLYMKNESLGLTGNNDTRTIDSIE